MFHNKLGSMLAGPAMSKKRQYGDNDYDGDEKGDSDGKSGGDSTEVYNSGNRQVPGNQMDNSATVQLCKKWACRRDWYPDRELMQLDDQSHQSNHQDLEAQLMPR